MQSLDTLKRLKLDLWLILIWEWDPNQCSGLIIGENHEHYIIFCNINVLKLRKMLELLREFGCK